MLRTVLANGLLRKITIVAPVLLIVLTFVFLAPSIGFKLFPSGDNPNVSFSITDREGTDTQAMLAQASGLDLLVA